MPASSVEHFGVAKLKEEEQGRFEVFLPFAEEELVLNIPGVGERLALQRILGILLSAPSDFGFPHAGGAVAMNSRGHLLVFILLPFQNSG